jgi:hypothetical protein
MRCVVAVAAMLLPSFASAAPPTAAVTIEATPLHARAHRNETTPITLRTTNTTGVRQAFQIMTCSWADEWKSDDPLLQTGGIDCSKNFQRTLVLDPGAVDLRTIDVYVDKTAALGPHVVRLGFTAIGSKTTIWSTAVTLQVVAIESGLAVSATHVKPREIAFTITNTASQSIEIADEIALQSPLDYRWGTRTWLSATSSAQPAVRCTTLAPGASITVAWSATTCGDCVGNYRIVPRACDGTVDYLEDLTRPQVWLPER